MNIHAILLASLLVLPLAAWPAPDTVDSPAAAAPINPRYVLLDTRGRMVSNEDFAGRFQLITFGYTSCPDVCPTELATMARALHALGPLSSRLTLVFISVDPQRDTPEVLAHYTSYFDPGIVALTGPADLLRACADHFKVKYRRFREPGAKAEDYSVDHTTGMYLLGPDGEFIRRFAEGIPVTQLSAELAAILQDAPSR
jgi:protein SCO1